MIIKSAEALWHPHSLYSFSLLTFIHAFFMIGRERNPYFAMKILMQGGTP